MAEPTEEQRVPPTAERKASRASTTAELMAEPAEEQRVPPTAERKARRASTTAELMAELMAEPTEERNALEVLAI
ncbi:hypothetical protein [Streptomyces sp. NPDC055056]